MAQSNNGSVRRIVAPSLRHFSNQFIRLKAHTWSKATNRAYAGILRLFGQFTEDRWPIEAVDIIDYLADLRRRNRSAATLDNYYRHIAAFVRFAHKMNWLKDDPTVQIKDLGLTPPKPAKEPKSYYDTELRQLTRYLRDIINTAGDTQQRRMAKRDLAIILLAYTTGARASEIAAWEINDFDLAHCAVYIRNESAKGNSQGWVAFDHPTRAAFMDWHDAKPKGRTACVFVALGGPTYGNSLSGHGLQQMLKRRCKEAGIVYRTFHALRHTAAYTAVEAGVSLPTVQYQLRHSRIETTAQYALGREAERLQAITERDLSKRILD